MRYCLLILLLIPTLTRPASAADTRLLRQFDFEERHLGNDEDLPMEWVKVEGDGLPHYVTGPSQHRAASLRAVQFPI